MKFFKFFKNNELALFGIMLVGSIIGTMLGISIFLALSSKLAGC